MMMNTKHSVFQAAGTLGFFSLMAKLVAMYRDHIFAATFGRSALLDSYYAAFRIPDLLFNLLILGTLSVAFIPIFTEYFVKDEEEAKGIANTVLTFTFLVMTALSVALFFFVPSLTHLIAPGFHGQQFDDTVRLTKIFLLSPIIFTISSVFSSVLNSLKRFALVAMAPIIYNVGIIVGAVFLYPRYGINGLAYGVILGALGHMLIQVPGLLRIGFRFKPNLSLTHPAITKIAKLFIPRIFGVDNAQISLLIASIIGSTLVTGTITVFNLANNLQAVPIGLFGISFAIAVFPNLSESFAKNDEEGFGHLLSRTVVNILYFIIPLSILVFLLRAQIVRVIYGSGQFDWQATRLTANTLGIFAASIFAQGLNPLFSRAFYSRHNTVIPVILSLFTMGLSALLSYIFGKMFGVYGLALGFSIANIVNLILLYIMISSRVKTLDHDHVFSSLGKILISTVLSAGITYLALNAVAAVLPLTTRLNVLAQAAVAATAGIIVFFLATWYFGMGEADYILKKLKLRKA